MKQGVAAPTHLIVKNLTVELLRAGKAHIQDSEETDLSRIQERIAHAKGAGRSRVERSVACVESFVFSQKTRQHRIDTPDDAARETENGVHEPGRRPEQTGDARGWVAARRGAAKSAENGVSAQRLAKACSLQSRQYVAGTHHAV